VHLNLLKDAKVVKIQNGAVAAQTLVTSSTIAMDGFDSVMIVADLGTVTDTAVLTLTAQDGALANGSDAASVAGAATPAFTAAGSSNGQLVLDVQQLQKEFLTVTLARTTANVVVNSITAILYNAHNKPTTQPTTVLASAEAEAAA
jgi:hypothetical protein